MGRPMGLHTLRRVPALLVSICPKANLNLGFSPQEFINSWIKGKRFVPINLIYGAANGARTHDLRIHSPAF